MVVDECLAGTDALLSLDAAYLAAWAAVDEQLLTLCRNRMAMLRRDESTLATMTTDERDALSRWPSSPDLGELEKAALDFTEQYLIDVASVTDEQVARLTAQLGDAGTVDFVNALLVIEQRMSLELFFGAVL